MAGSYNHCVETETGKLLVNEDLVRLVENLGDAYEAIEELYGMVWWLASTLEESDTPGAGAGFVEAARENYRVGLKRSPGTDGHIPEEDDDE